MNSFCLLTINLNVEKNPLLHFRYLLNNTYCSLRSFVIVQFSSVPPFHKLGKKPTDKNRNTYENLITDFITFISLFVVICILEKGDVFVSKACNFYFQTNLLKQNEYLLNVNYWMFIRLKNKKKNVKRTYTTEFVLRTMFSIPLNI